jgi:hypothetical protein
MTVDTRYAVDTPAGRLLEGKTTGTQKASKRRLAEASVKHVPKPPLELGMQQQD